MRKLGPAFTIITLIGLLFLTAVLAVGCPRSGPSGGPFRSADITGSNQYRGPLGATEDAEAGAPDHGQDAAPRVIVEPDVIRQDGNLLYILNQSRGLTLVDLDSGSVLAQAPTYGYPRDLYLRDGRAYVLVSRAADFQVEGTLVRFDVTSRVYVVDISRPGRLEVLSSFNLPGDLMDSRLAGDVLYAATAEYEWYWAEAPVVKQAQTRSWVTSVNIASPAAPYQADQLVFSGAGTVLHATPEAVFVAAPHWAAGTTSITYVDISDPAGVLALRGAVQVHGHIADRFKLDVHDGVLRTASNTFGLERDTIITTVALDDPDALEVLAAIAIENAAGETLFATRFDGDRAYLVTFLMVDPLFVVDLSDPRAPAVTGELKVPGWSTHIEPWGDRLIALGVDDTDGSRRVSVSLFDVANPAAPALLDRVAFGSAWGWSQAYSDVKALARFDGVLVVPFSGWAHERGGYERLQFISYNENALNLHGYVDVRGAALRTIEFGGAYFGVTSEELARIDAPGLDAPEVTARTPLAQNVVDFLELSPALAAEIIHETATDLTRVQLRALPGFEPLGVAEAAIGVPERAFTHGDTVLLTGVVWEEQPPRYAVAFVDCSNPASPGPPETIGVRIEPYSAGWWWGGPYPIDLLPGGAVDPGQGGDAPVSDAASGAAERLWFPGWAPWVPSGPGALQVGSVLALRGRSASADETVGSHLPAPEVLALVDIPSRHWTATIGLGFEELVSLAVAGNRLYAGSRAGASQFGDRRPMTAYYLTELTLAPGGAGLSAGPTVNVPGEWAAYDPDSQRLILRDFQWLTGGAIESTLESLTWDGRTPPTKVDQRRLPESVIQVLARGSTIVADYYDNGYHLARYQVQQNGAITVRQPLNVTPLWGTLLDANSNVAYVTFAGQAVAVYDLRGAGGLLTLTGVMGSPQHIRFGETAAYAPLGYAGVASLPIE